MFTCMGSPQMFTVAWYELSHTVIPVHGLFFYNHGRRHLPPCKMASNGFERPFVRQTMNSMVKHQIPWESEIDT